MDNRRGAAARRPWWPGELGVLLGLLFVYDRIAGLARVRYTSAVGHGRDLLALEHGLDLGDLELRLDHLLAGTGWLQAPAAYFYNIAHIWVTVAVLVTAYVLRPSVYRHARTALVGINLIGLGIFLAYPVAPPRLLPGGGFVDVVALSHTWFSWEGRSGVSQRANELGSMPSLHAAWAIWVALTVTTLTARRGLRALGWAHVVLTTVVVVATGNHYLVDVLAGAATCGVAWGLTAVRRAPALPAPRRSPARVDVSVG